MKKFFSSKFFYLITFLTLAAVIVPTVLCIMGYSSFFRSAVNTVLSPLRSLSLKAAEAVEGYASYFTEYDKLLSEYESLKEENANLKEQLYQYKELSGQYEWLSEYLELKMQNPEYKLLPAKVTGRQSGNYSTIYMLDTGSGSGVKKNMTVVTGDGVLGYISEFGKNWSKVSTIFEPGNSTAGYVERTGDMGLVIGDYLVLNDGLCVMKYLGEHANIEVGDRILTSGYGSIYPRGLTIGYVEKIKVDDVSRSIIAYVRPASIEDVDSSNKISQVMIIIDGE